MIDKLRNVYIEIIGALPPEELVDDEKFEELLGECSNEEINKIIIKSFKNYKIQSEDVRKHIKKKIKNSEYKTKGILPVTYLEELKDCPKDDIWRVDKMISKRGICLIGGCTGVYKTTTCLSLAVDIIKNKLFLNKFKTEPCKVLYINEENQEFILKERVKLISPKVDLNSLAFLNFSGFKFDDDLWYYSLRNFLSKNPEFKLIIVDPFRRAHTCKEDVADEMSPLLTNIIQPIIQEFGVAFLFMHHLRKKSQNQKYRKPDIDDFRGSSELTNYVDTVFILQKRGGGKDGFIMHNVKNRLSEAIPAIITNVNWDEEEGINIEYESDFKEETEKINKCCSDLILFFKNFEGEIVKRMNITEALKDEYPKKTIDRAIKELCDKGNIVRESRGKYRGENLNE